MSDFYFKILFHELRDMDLADDLPTQIAGDPKKLNMDDWKKLNESAKIILDLIKPFR